MNTEPSGPGNGIQRTSEDPIPRCGRLEPRREPLAVDQVELSMKARALIAAIGCCAAGLTAIWWLTREPLPRYAGKHALAWFQQYQDNQGGVPLQVEARDAFRVMGDTAASFLCQVLRDFEPDRSARVPEFLREVLPEGIYRRFVRSSGVATVHSKPGSPPTMCTVAPLVYRNPTVSKDRCAWNLLAAIRPSAGALSPWLDKALRSPDPSERWLAIRLAGYVGAGGSNAVPRLVEALHENNGALRLAALCSLERLGSQARGAVPALIDGLDRANPERELRALASIGADASAAIPQIERFLEPEQNPLRLLAAMALCRIEPGHPSMAILMDAVGHERGAGRQVAVRLLGDIGPGAKGAAPMLLAEVKNGVYRNDALNALRKIDPANHNAVALLLRRVRDSDAVERLNAASWLARWEPPHEAGISALAEIARSHPDDGMRIEAMYHLARVGMRGESAVPALEIAARDPDPKISSAAACTLRNIRGGVSSNPE